MSEQTKNSKEPVVRAVILDTNTGTKTGIFSLEIARPFFKSIDKITLLKERTTEENVRNIDPENVIGYIDHIKPYKGVFRGNVYGTSKHNDMLISEFIEIGGTINVAYDVMGSKPVEGKRCQVSEILDIYYAYLFNNEEE